VCEKSAVGVKIHNSPLQPTRTFQPHHIRHMVSGTLVFLLGIAANEGLMHMRRHWPRSVRWSPTEIQTDYTMPEGLPPTNVLVDIGITEDGFYVWRPQRSKD
jgi:hypothetical protein